MCGNEIRVFARCIDASLADGSAPSAARNSMKGAANWPPTWATTKIWGTARVAVGGHTWGERHVDVDMGNPHAVAFVRSTTSPTPAAARGARARPATYPSGMNVRVRGAARRAACVACGSRGGPRATRSCGTGACAGVMVRPRPWPTASRTRPSGTSPTASMCPAARTVRPSTPTTGCCSPNGRRGRHGPHHLRQDPGPAAVLQMRLGHGSQRAIAVAGRRHQRRAARLSARRPRRIRHRRRRRPAGRQGRGPGRGSSWACFAQFEHSADRPDHRRRRGRRRDRPLRAVVELRRIGWAPERHDRPRPPRSSPRTTCAHLTRVVAIDLDVRRFRHGPGRHRDEPQRARRRAPARAIRSTWRRASAAFDGQIGQVLVLHLQGASWAWPASPCRPRGPRRLRHRPERPGLIDTPRCTGRARGAEAFEACCSTPSASARQKWPAWCWSSGQLCVNGETSGVNGGGTANAPEVAWRRPGVGCNHKVRLRDGRRPRASTRRRRWAGPPAPQAPPAPPRGLAPDALGDHRAGPAPGRRRSMPDARSCRRAAGGKSSSRCPRSPPGRPPAGPTITPAMQREAPARTPGPSQHGAAGSDAPAARRLPSRRRSTVAVELPTHARQRGGSRPWAGQQPRPTSRRRGKNRTCPPTTCRRCRWVTRRARLSLEPGGERHRTPAGKRDVLAQETSGCSPALSWATR